jgi:CheY-like chemotaxis protein
LNDKTLTREILVIDDDPIMRDLITDWLEAAGYAVNKATDCNAACTALERAPALVVSDMWMPGPCGAEAIRWMREKHPGLQLHQRAGCGEGGRGARARQADQARRAPRCGRRADWPFPEVGSFPASPSGGR